MKETTNYEITRIAALHIGTYVFCGSMGWLLFSVTGLAAGLATAALVIVVANLKS